MNNSLQLLQVTYCSCRFEGRIHSNGHSIFNVALLSRLRNKENESDGRKFCLKNWGRIKSEEGTSNRQKNYRIRSAAAAL